MNLEKRGGITHMVLGGLCGAVISGACTFNILMLVMFARYDLSFGSQAALLWVSDKWSVFRDSEAVLLIALGSLPGALAGMIFGRRIGEREVIGGRDLVIGGAGLAAIAFSCLVVILKHISVLHGDVHVFEDPVALFGGALAGITGAMVGFVIALLKPPKTTPATLPDPGWGSDMPPKRDTPAQIKDHIATNPGQVFPRSTGERDA